MCRKCAGGAANRARRVPELLAELRTTVTRQSQQSAAGAHPGKGTNPPAAVNFDAMTIRDDLVDTVRAWTMTPGVRLTDPAWYRADVDGPTAADEVAYAYRVALAAIDQAPERKFVGRCSCGAELFVRDGRDEVTCPRCATKLDAAAGRAQLVEDVRAELATSAALRAALSSWAGVTVKPATLRAWVARGKLTPLACDVATHHPQYRIGDVLDLVSA